LTDFASSEISLKTKIFAGESTRSFPAGIMDKGKGVKRGENENESVFLL
jgi:hypothetical protein